MTQTKQTSPRSRRKPSAREPLLDRDKLRIALRKLGDEYVFYMLDDAIDVLSEAKLAKVVSRYLDVKQLRASAPGDLSLGAAVRAFVAASRVGTYYQDFDVNSKNFTTRSIGTRAFIADCNRLLDRCVRAAPKGDAAEIREAIELVLGLLQHIDECHDDVVFFADEGGSWQVGVEWKKVLPVLFLCLSRTTDADDYARHVIEVVRTFDRHDSARHCAAAERIGTSDQRKALMDLRAVDT